MVGVIAFSIFMLAFSAVTFMWMNGKLPEFARTQRDVPNLKGRVVTLSLRGRSTTFRLNSDLWVRLAFIALGPSAILGLSVAYAEILPLRVMFALFVFPAYIGMVVLGLLYPKWGWRALIGFCAGVIATLLYDIVRLFLVVALDLPDPIPHIGDLWLGADTVSHGGLWWVGYLWRFFGNGAGMGIVYAMLSPKVFNLKGGWIYGDLVGLGMFALLFFFPASQIHLFPLNLTVLVNGILGHWAYGLALGWLFGWTRLKYRFEEPSLSSDKPLSWVNTR